MHIELPLADSKRKLPRLRHANQQYIIVSAASGAPAPGWWWPEPCLFLVSLQLSLFFVLRRLSEGLSGMQKFPTSLRQPDIQSEGERVRGKKAKSQVLHYGEVSFGFSTPYHSFSPQDLPACFLSLLLSFSFWLVSLWLREVIYYLAQSVAIIYINQSWWPLPEVHHRMSNGLKGLLSTGLNLQLQYVAIKPDSPIPWIKTLFVVYFAFWCQIFLANSLCPTQCKLLLWILSFAFLFLDCKDIIWFLFRNPTYPLCIQNQLGTDIAYTPCCTPRACCKAFLRISRHISALVIKLLCNCTQIRVARIKNIQLNFVV